MKAMCFEKTAVLLKNGMPDAKSYISAGDLCEIGEKAKNGFYPVKYPTKLGKKTRYLRELSGFLCNQNDYSYVPYPAKGYEKATIKSGGCGICASVNLVGAVCGKKVPVTTMRDIATLGGARVSGGTNMRKMADLICRRYGMTCLTTNSLPDLIAHLKSGGAAICNVSGTGMFSSGGHYMCVLGVLGRQLAIADSGFYRSKYRKTVKGQNRRWHVAVSGDMILTLPQTLDKACAARAPRYYLFKKTKGA